MDVKDNYVACPELLDLVKVRALCDHWFGPYYTPGFGAPKVPEGEWDVPLENWRGHLLPFDQMVQLTQYDQWYTPYRVECDTKVQCTVTVQYDDRGYAATYGINCDGSIDLWMD